MKCFQVACSRQGHTKGVTSRVRTPDERASDQVIVELPPGGAGPARARAEIRSTFARWGLDVLIDDAELAVSELVTNAFKHGLPPVVLTLDQGNGRVRMDVSDTRPATTSVQWPVSLSTDESGRGMGIIAAVSDRSGTDGLAGEGKTAYASWDVDPHTPSGA